MCLNVTFSAITPEISGCTLEPPFQNPEDGPEVGHSYYELNINNRNCSSSPNNMLITIVSMSLRLLALCAIFANENCPNVSPVSEMQVGVT